MAARVKAAGVKLMIQVQSVQQAIDAVSLGADAIVAQVCQPPDWTSSCPLQSDLCAASKDSNFPGQVHVNQADLPEYATAKIQSNVHWWTSCEIRDDNAIKLLGSHPALVKMPEIQQVP